MDAKAIVGKLLLLASEPGNRAHMIPKGQKCVPGITMFLAHTDAHVAHTAARVVHLLTLWSPNRARMAAEPKLVPLLRIVAATGCSEAQSAADVLQSSAASPGAGPSGGASSSSSSSSSSAPSAAPSRTRKVVGGFYARRTPARTAQTHTVYVRELTTEEHRARLEAQLLAVQGVVSFLIDVVQGKAVVRTMTPLDAVTKAVRDLGWTPSLQPKGAPAHASCSKENAGYARAEQGHAHQVVPKGTPQRGRGAQSRGSWWGNVGSYLWG